MEKFTVIPDHQLHHAQASKCSACVDVSTKNGHHWLRSVCVLDIMWINTEAFMSAFLLPQYRKTKPCAYSPIRLLVTKLQK